MSVRTSSSSWSAPRVPTLFLSCVVLVLSLVGCVHGTHYIKYHISDSCVSHSSHPGEVRLMPNTNTTAVMIKLRREFYKPNMNCTLVLRAPPGYGMTLFFTKFKLRRQSSKKADRLEIVNQHDGTMLARYYGHNQDELPKRNVVATQNVLLVNFLSEHFAFSTSLVGKGFKMVVNLHSVVKSDGQCNTTSGLSINCGNGFCIDPSLECDNINNCLNNADEIECDETSETKLSLYVFLSTIILMIILVVMFLMKTKDKRKLIVRRMSRVYANNPILCVMETSTGHNNISSIAPASGRTSPIPSSPTFSPAKRTNIDIESKLPPTLAYLDDNNAKAKRTLKTSKSKISLSLPQGIDQLSTNSSPPRS